MVTKTLVDTVDALDSGEVPSWISQHLRDYLESGGQEGHWWDATAVGGDGTVPCLLLTVRGRRSATLRTHPLVYAEDGDRYVVVGSKGGADKHPHWVHNLRAEPNVTVQVGPESFSAFAREALDGERERLWHLVTQVFPGYDAYQARTEREIPLFIIERTAA